MPMPSSIEARLYYRCSFQRHDDAQVLLRADHTTGAIYLAGYGVECILKALILNSLAVIARRGMLNSFRGARAHDYEWLRTQYFENGGARFLRDVTEAFTFVNDWSTDLRYLPRIVKADEAEAFLSAAEQIIKWADGRF
jgi:hypothetical protein